ncbi:glycoside hydrolase N-terminal domain-containing protein [Planctomycetota bacterium]|nr:glycoside hydrolase N-terminal domain-containing protein [Planctomycetota bacterium]
MSSIRHLIPALSTIILIATTFASNQPPEPPRPFLIHDTAPAPQWEQAYVVGNGRLGATSLGSFPSETIILNEETVWERKPDTPLPTDARAILEQARTLIQDGSPHLANQLYTSKLQSQNARPSAYQLLANLNIKHNLQATSPTFTFSNWKITDTQISAKNPARHTITLSAHIDIPPDQYPNLINPTIVIPRTKAFLDIALNKQHLGSSSKWNPITNYPTTPPTSPNTHLLKPGQNTIFITYKNISTDTPLPAPATLTTTPPLTRSLDFYRGINTTNIALPQGQITRTLIASHPHNLIALNITNTTPQGLDLTLALSRPAGASTSTDHNDLLITGQAVLTSDFKTPAGTKFQARLHPIINTSKTNLTITPDNQLQIQGGSSLTLLITAATDYNYNNPRAPLTPNFNKQTLKPLISAKNLSFNQILTAATNDTASLMSRCNIDLGSTPSSLTQLTTPKRLAHLKQNHLTNIDPDFIEDLFQFGRYLLISSSRPNTLPANLQGIWNPHLYPRWNADFHLNINLQMNYWPAEVTNLSSLHKPLLDFTKRLLPQGKTLAQTLGYDGFTTGHATDAFLQSRIMTKATWWGGSLTSSSWLTDHLFTHYQFTQDKTFLASAFPVLEQNARFFLTWLKPDPNTNLLLTGPGASPENSFWFYDKQNKKHQVGLSLGCTYDQQLAHQSLTNYLTAARILDIQNQYTSASNQALDQLAPTTPIGPDGRVMEWRKPEYIEREYDHRHLSHLYAFFPGSQYNTLENPAFTNAALKSLNTRFEHSQDHTGWNLGWMTNLYATLGQSDRALECIQRLFKMKISPNLFDLHPPFQIDGNFGATAGIAHLLIKSNAKTPENNTIIELLPALPNQLHTGSAQGLRARGNFTIDQMTWKNSHLTSLTITSHSSLPTTILANNKTYPLIFTNNQTQTLTFPAP